MFIGALANPNAYSGLEDYGGIFLYNIACTGNESMLIDCISSSNNIDVHNCQHYNDTSVMCQSNKYYTSM